MSDHAEDRRPAPSRRTIVLLGGWIVAAVIAGVPAGAGTNASADTGSDTPRVSVVNTGPECFAGKSAPSGAGHDSP